MVDNEGNINMLQPTVHLRVNGSVFEQLWMSPAGGEGEWRALNSVDTPRKRFRASPATAKEIQHGPVHYLDKGEEPTT